MNIFSGLKEFRNRAYCLLGKGKDALFNLMDAVLTSRSVSSFAELSLSPLFERQWSSLYKVLERSQPPAQALMELCIPHLPTEPALGEHPQLLLAGDHTAWSRLWSPTLKERTYEHQPQPSPGSKPVTLGQGYSSLVCIPQEQGSWALPLLHERITSFETPLEKAAAQLKQVCVALKAHPLPTLAKRPLSMWDAEYGCARFIQLTHEIDCDKLMRLRSNRVLYGPPPAYSGRGRPRIHGEKFKLNDPNTWWTPDQPLDVHDQKLGHIRLQRWSALHFRQSATHPMELILVERLNAAGERTHRPLWLAWTGESMPDLSILWQLYLRRFCVEHWYRFIKQRLHWCLPQLGTAEQCEAWSTLMPLMSWQLWLARNHIQDCRLPWQKALTHPTPGRVANGFATILANIGTPAESPKPRGKSPGWPTGKARIQRKRFPTVRKSYSKPKSQEKVAA
jgi:hypothetical protein